MSSVKPGKTTTDKAANFSKGTLIELSSGEVKRVEDMRTEDFISSSCKNPNLLVINTTVIKMVLQSTQVVLITLAYKNRKVSLVYFYHVNKYRRVRRRIRLTLLDKTSSLSMDFCISSVHRCTITCTTKLHILPFCSKSFRTRH